MAVTSQTMSSAAGDIDLTIEFAASPSVELVDVSEIRYNFDINDVTSDTLTSIPQIIQDVTITCYDTLSDGTSLITTVLEVGGERDVDLEIGGYLFPLVYEKGNYDTDDINNMVTFTATVKDTYEISPTAATFATVYDNGGSDNYEVAPIGQAIREVIEKYGGTTSTLLIDSTHYNELTAPGDLQWGAYRPNPDWADDFLLRLSKSEGALWGVGFNTNFWVSRKSTSNKVNITPSQILDINRKRTIDDVKDIAIDFANTGSPFQLSTAFNVSNSVSKNVNARQSVAIETIMEEMVYYEYTGTRFEATTDAIAQSAAVDVTDDGLDNVSLALRADSDFQVNIAVEGFDTIKPWQSFEITSVSAPESQFLDNFTNYIYRPSEMTYTIDNQCQITAYAIATT